MSFSALEFDRITVWKQTQEHYKELPEIGSECVKGIDESAYASAERPYTTELVFQERDCIYSAVDLIQQGMNPLLLNMADWEVAGGCVDTGSSAQEEELFRRSNYFKHLLQSYYPLDEETAYVSKGVEFYRKGMLEGCVSMDTPVKIDCVASPAVRFPQLGHTNREEFGNQKDIDLMLFKIRQLFWIAQKNGNDSLVLSAWGCGAFGCPAAHVARLFRQVYEERQGVFKKVVFAILGPNYTLFTNAWNGVPTRKSSLFTPYPRDLIKDIIISKIKTLKEELRELGYEYESDCDCCEDV